MHDVLEDSNLTEGDLLECGLDKEVVYAVKTLTRKENQNYFSYIKQIKNNDTAGEVKIQDLKHNMQLNRLKDIKIRDLVRWIKYKVALSILI